MSEKVIPEFTVNGERYELHYTRAMQVEYQRMTKEKKTDAQFQKEIAVAENLKAKYDKINTAYVQAENAYLEDMFNDELEKKYLKLKDLQNEAFNEYVNYISEHENASGSEEYMLYMVGELVLFGLAEQYKLTKEQATAIWDAYIEDVGELGAMEFLSYVAVAFFTVDDEGTSPNPFVAKMRKRFKKK